jgi:hypothetical protein
MLNYHFKVFMMKSRNAYPFWSGFIDCVPDQEKGFTQSNELHLLNTVKK